MTEEQRDYLALEVQYTDLNALWMAKCKEADRLRVELQAAADTMHLAGNQLKHMDPDVSARLTNQWSQADRALRGVK